jgi:uncharacterized protein
MALAMNSVGTIAEIRRYPVKSMLGEELQSTAIHSAGLVGDRICALIDRETGRVVTAKRPHRWRAVLALRASYRNGPDGVGVDIVMPDGTQLDGRNEQTARALSTFLGREVAVEFVRPQGLELERSNPDEVADRGVDAATGLAVIPVGMAAPEGGFFDYAPIHFIATSSLNKVAAVASAVAAEPVRFRPNFVIATPAQLPFAENNWVGGTLQIGPEVLLEVLLPTPRCAVPTLVHGTVPADPQLTRRIGALNTVPVLDMGPLACLGAYARVVRGGSVAIGDPVWWDATSSNR